MTSITKLLEESFISKVTKTCGVCCSNTEHSELTFLDRRPNILVIVINRFLFDINARKNKTNIILEEKICHNSVNYDLICSVHHHGDSLYSGHYTSRIYYTDVIFDCNDNKITKLSKLEKVTNTAYLVIYKPNVL